MLCLFKFRTEFDWRFAGTVRPCGGGGEEMAEEEADSWLVKRQVCEGVSVYHQTNNWRNSFTSVSPFFFSPCARRDERVAEAAEVPHRCDRPTEYARQCARRSVIVGQPSCHVAAVAVANAAAPLDLAATGRRRNAGAAAAVDDAHADHSVVVVVVVVSFLVRVRPKGLAGLFFFLLFVPRKKVRVECTTET